jgi:pimeloyl-ACP methyl ester carboxylesterase
MPHFDATGPRGAPSILLVHGSVVTRVVWRPQLRALSNEYRAIAPDLPGHGSLAGQPFTFASAVESLAALIRTEAEGRALVVGLSLGGYVAIDLAAKHPGLVSGLVLTGSSLSFRGLLALYLKAVSGLMKRGWLTQTRATAETKTRRLFPPSLANVGEAQIQAGVHPEWLGPAFGEMAGRDFAAVLARYGGPGVIVNGARDKPMKRGAAAFAAALRPGHVEIIPDAGHACNLDRPDEYNRVIRDFAASIGWGARARPLGNS